MAAAPLSPGHAQLLALLRAVDRDDPSGAGGGLAALDDSIAMGQPHSPAAAGAPSPPPAALGPLAQLILDGAAAAAADGDAPLDADDELAFDGTAAAAADAAVELTGGDGHPPPDDWALAAMGGGDAGAADDGDAPTDGLAAVAAAALLLAELTVGGLLRGWVAAVTVRPALLHCSLCGIGGRCAIPKFGPGRRAREGACRGYGGRYALLSRLACLTSRARASRTARAPPGPGKCFERARMRARARNLSLHAIDIDHESECASARYGYACVCIFRT